MQQKEEAHPQEGFWKIYNRLRQEGNLWNHKKVYRVYKDIGLPIRERALPKYPLRESRLLQLPETLNHTWTLDFNWAEIHDMPCCSFHVTDERSREALRVAVMGASGTQFVLEQLDYLLKNRAKPKRIQIEDQPELIHSLVEEWGQANEVEIIFILHCELYPVVYLEGFGALIRKHLSSLNNLETHNELVQFLRLSKKVYNSRLQVTLLQGLGPTKFADGVQFLKSTGMNLNRMSRLKRSKVTLFDLCVSLATVPEVLLPPALLYPIRAPFPAP
ncbi:transposase [Pontibacter diazotrophicus]|uniref:Transposase n=1 Tax=Pontibacter diazotrophicus TaxID=1400979 RepID=A0A3D8LI30_9BACT|nr:transposase [Pontibacter diazotrophicus]